MNQVQLVGNIARDPEFRTTQSGIAACTFTVACQRRYANAQGVREADFIQCVAWRQTAEFVHRYFIKGNKIGLTGSIKTRSYDAQDGSKRYVTEVVVDNVEFVAAKSDGSGAPAAQAQTSYQQPQQQAPAQPHQMTMNEGFTEVDDYELPF